MAEPPPELPPAPAEGASDGELKRQQLLLDRTKYELEARKFSLQQRDLLARLPIAITAIAGVTAILFQCVGGVTAYYQRDAAASELEAKKLSQRADYDLRALDFLVKNSDGLIGCQDASGADADAVASLGEFMSEPGRRVLQRAINRAALKCATDKQSQAATPTKGDGAAPTVDVAKVREARYSEIERQASVLQASTALTTSGPQLPTVFLHYAQDADRDRAAELQMELAGLGYKAPGVQHVSVAPRRMQIRYYKDDQRALAEALAAAVTKQLRLTAPPELQSLQRSFPKLPRDVLEIWFPVGG